MLYLFDITKFPSNWMHLDMGLTAVSVQTLKEHIESKYKINVEDQVLLISGGVCLDSSKIVCHYSAGTDSNPIYFFNKRIDKTANFPECSNFSTKSEGKSKNLSILYKKYAKVTPSFQAVIDRASLAEKFANSASSLLEHCEEIIRDHHIANQGWLAAIANYDDVVSNCHTHFDESQKNFERYLGERDYFLSFLEKFKDKLPIFKKIPILRKLLRPNDGDNKLMIESHTSEGAREKEIEDPSLSFFDWVGQDEHGNSIDTIYKNCEEEVEFYKEDYFRNSFSSVPHTLAAADSSNKEINVAFWLSHLDQLMIQARKIVEEQIKISSSIQLNVARMKDCKDLSILPHLCETHEQELKVMNENHQILKNIESTCIKAKYEFTLNVQSRINWIVHIENELQHVGVQMDIFNETLERLKYQIAILEKIYNAPNAYLSCISETVRRRSFSQAFLMWASEMACRLHTMHNDEVARRKEFLSKYEDTFIQMLFPGLDDLPPSYGTKAPSYFDTSLPKLTIEDIDFLKKMLPDLPKELTECLSLEDSSNLSDYLSSKLCLDIQADKFEPETQPENLVDKVENLSANLDQSNIKEGVGESSLTAIHSLPHLKDVDRGCESETDTEEFEKVGQSPLELNVSSQKHNTQDVSTSTEENLELCKSEYNKLRSIVSQACTLASQSLVRMKSEFEELKSDYSLSKSDLMELLNALMIRYEKLCDEQKSHEQSVVMRLTTDHKNEISDFRRLAQVKNEEIKNLRTNLTFLENKMKKISEDVSIEKQNSDDYKKKYEDLRLQVYTLENEKEKSIREVTERLNREHMDKMKTLQSRFRLMTMERTPSDSSLEKALEFSTSINHESIYIQMRDNFEFEKEKFMRETLLLETEKWKKTVEELQNKFESEKKQLNAVIELYSERFDQLRSKTEESSRVENTPDIQKEKDETVAPKGSVSEGKVDTATSPIRRRKSISKTWNILRKSNKPSLDSMQPGDTLVIVWDEEHENFRIVQKGPFIYFLHLDCLESLGLSIQEGSPKRPNKLYCMAEFVERDCCYARKSENRFNVPQGTRFFRVTVKALQQEKPVQPMLDEPMECFTSSQHSSSISIAEMELPPMPVLSKWKFTPNKLPPETFPIVQEDIPGVRKQSDNKHEDSNDSLRYETANYDNDLKQEPVDSGDCSSESLR